jgi:hypothetical protein
LAKQNKMPRRRQWMHSIWQSEKKMVLNGF